MHINNIPTRTPSLPIPRIHPFSVLARPVIIICTCATTAHTGQWIIATRSINSYIIIIILAVLLGICLCINIIIIMIFAMCGCVCIDRSHHKTYRIIGWIVNSVKLTTSVYALFNRAMLRKITRRGAAVQNYKIIDDRKK